MSRSRSRRKDLRTHTYGQWTEDYVRQAARQGGQPDFTFAPVETRRGPGTREVGDTLIWLGHQLAIVSVKSRDISLLGADSPERAKSWLDKQIPRAAAQIEGSIRTLRNTAGLMLRSDRGIEVPWEPERVRQIFGVIVINYSPPPGYIPSFNLSVPALCLLAAEWEFILQTVRSTSGLMTYLDRRTRFPVTGLLGAERDMLATFLESEFSGTPPRLPGGRPDPGKWDALVERHPAILLGSDPDDQFAFVVDAIIAGIGDLDPAWSQGLEPHSYLLAAETLERIPRLERVHLGKRIMEKCRLAYEEQRRRYFAWGLRNGQLFFLAHPGSREERRSDLEQFVLAVHTKRREEGEPEDFVTLRIATEPYPNEGRSHDSIYLRGTIRLTEQERRRRDDFIEEYLRPLRPVDQDVIRRLSE